jgi:hypothetical protein
MHSILITLAIFAAVALIHFSYVDFRFRHRDGFWWYWLLNPAPPLMWVSRAAIVAALIAALSVKFVGTGEVLAFVVVGLLVLHIVTLILLEVLEPGER